MPLGRANSNKQAINKKKDGKLLKKVKNNEKILGNHQENTSTYLSKEKSRKNKIWFFGKIFGGWVKIFIDFANFSHLYSLLLVFSKESVEIECFSERVWGFCVEINCFGNYYHLYSILLVICKENS